MLGVPMVPVEARNHRGIDTLLDTVIDVYENRDERVRHIHINMGPVIEEGLRRLNSDMSDHRDELPKAFPPRYYAMKMLEGDAEAEKSLRECRSYPEWAEMRPRGPAHHRSAGRGCRNGLRQPEIRIHPGSPEGDFHPRAARGRSRRRPIDTFVTHKLWGFPDLLRADVVHVLVHVQPRSLSAGSGSTRWWDGWIGGGVDALLPAGPLRETCWWTASSAAWAPSSSSSRTS